MHTKQTAAETSDRCVPVDLRAVLARANRVLRAEGGQFLRARSKRLRRELGTVYLIDHRVGAVIRTHVDLEAVARQTGLLRPYEQMINSGVSVQQDYAV